MMHLLPWGMVLLGLVVALGCWLAYQVLGQNGRILQRLDALEARLEQVPAGGRATAAGVAQGLPVGVPAPAFELPDLNGSRLSLGQLRGRPVLLIFFNPGCGFCTRMAPELAALPVDGGNSRPLPVVVTTGDAEANRKLVEEHGIRCPVLLQKQYELFSAYQVSGTPSGYLIDAAGKIASELPVGAPSLLALAGEPSATGNGRSGHGALGGKRSVEESKINRSGLKPGTAAPRFRVPRLGGGELSLEEYRGSRVLLVFSDAKCGPCADLDAKLAARVREMREVQVLMVSRGEEAVLRAKVAQHGLTFPVGMQRQREVSRLYEMFHTPMAYLIDDQGTIAAEVAVGVDPILSLLSGAAADGNGKARAARRGKEVVPMRK